VVCEKDDFMTAWYVYADTVIIVFQAPWSLTFWLVYERIRNVSGMAGFWDLITVNVELFYCGGFIKRFTTIKALQEWVFPVSWLKIMMTLKLCKIIEEREYTGCKGTKKDALLIAILWYTSSIQMSFTRQPLDS